MPTTNLSERVLDIKEYINGIKFLEKTASHETYFSCKQLHTTSQGDALN